jgi:hypothetical protein
VLATASAAGISEETSANQNSAKPAATARNTPALGHTLAKPCTTDCCASAANGVRKPRPREISLLINGGNSLAPLTRSFSVPTTATFATGASLQRALPRGPPSSFS